MRQILHPISGAIYRELGDGMVRVDDTARKSWGIFRMDGSWVEGSLTHADPLLIQFVGGPDMPPGRDIYWGMIPPYEPNDGAAICAGGQMVTAGRGNVAEPIIARYAGDPGKVTADGVRSSSFIDQAFFLENDRKPELIPKSYHFKSPMQGGPVRIDTARFFAQEYHDREVERIWKCMWQMACREDDIPDVGDYLIYEIAHLSFLIIRTGPDEFKAHYNACMHRGRMLSEHDGKSAKLLRCPYHGWSWNIDGSLKEITTEWDFPGVREDVCQLPGAKVGRWAGFIFINPDLDAEPLQDYLGPVLLDHYDKAKLENRYKQAHYSKVLKANWKVVMEAFKESYHVIATHPQMLLSGGDLADTRYDVFGNFARAGHVGTSISSPQRAIIKSPEEALAAWRASADMNKAFLRGIIGDEVDIYSDAELNDVTFNDIFPNIHPWGTWGRMVIRFRPNGGNPNEALLDIMMLAPWPAGKPKPPAAKIQHLREDESWTSGVTLGSFARILDQDVFNLPKVQAGLKTKYPPYVWYSAYQEGMIRNFHSHYDRIMEISS
jgi:phenylpropionate dioxygenase-like ring-hydroxylating dioxygenase large terminal subunit